MRGDRIAEMFERAGPRLFARNIRGYLGEGKPVNEDMRLTLLGEPDRFFYYNNGITILCDEATQQSNEGRDVLHVKHPQIINGQQTTRTLAADRERAANASVLVKVIAVKERTSNDAKFDDLLSRIVAGTNWQNAIKQSDLMANDRIQIALERSLRKLGYGYIRKTQGPGEAKVHFGGKHFFQIKKEEFAQAVAACEIDGHVARSSKEKLFDETTYKKLFKSWDPFFYLGRYWLSNQVKRTLPNKDKRRETRWLVVSFVWSRLAPHLTGPNQLRAFADGCHGKLSELTDPLERAINVVATVAMQFYRAKKGKGPEEVDAPAFFKNKRSSLTEFLDYLETAGKELVSFDRHIARVCGAIGCAASGF